MAPDISRYDVLKFAAVSRTFRAKVSFDDLGGIACNVFPDGIVSDTLIVCARVMNILDDTCSGIWYAVVNWNFDQSFVHVVFKRGMKSACVWCMSLKSQPYERCRYCAI